MASLGSGATFLAWWGAGLSTLLALVKSWELWRDRFQIEIGQNFTGSIEIGNEIFIRNLSGHTFILVYWELLYCEGHWPRRRFTGFESAEYDAGDRRIEPHATHTLTFAQQNYFDWGQKALKGRRIYIRIYVAGRRPIVRLVYAP